MKNKTGFFKSIIYSISKPSFANEIVEKRNGIAYLALLSLIISTVLSLALVFSIYVSGSGKDIVNEMNNSLPDFELKNGHLSIDVDEPLIIDGGNSLMVIDNGNDASAMDAYETYSGQKIYINPDKIISYQGLQVNTLKFADFPNYSLTRAGLINLIWAFALLVPAFYFIGKFIGLLLTGMFMALIIALIGLIINSGLKTELTFKNLYTLSLFSLTGLYLLEGVMNFLHKTVAYGIPANMNLYISYIIMALFMYLYINAIKQKQDEQKDNADAALSETEPPETNGLQ